MCDYRAALGRNSITVTCDSLTEGGVSQSAPSLVWFGYIIVVVARFPLYMHPCRRSYPSIRRKSDTFSSQRTPRALPRPGLGRLFYLLVPKHFTTPLSDITFHTTISHLHIVFASTHRSQHCWSLLLLLGSEQTTRGSHIASTLSLVYEGAS